MSTAMIEVETRLIRARVKGGEPLAERADETAEAEDREDRAEPEVALPDAEDLVGERHELAGDRADANDTVVPTNVIARSVSWPQSHFRPVRTSSRRRGRSSCARR